MEHRDQRIIIPIPAGLLRDVDDYRYLNRFVSRAEAVRHLLKLGLVNYAVTALEEAEGLPQELTRMLARVRANMNRKSK